MSVYFITCRELGMVKIGHATNAQRRVWELQTSAPCKLRLEAVIPGARREEHELHTRLSALRIRGEWFRLAPQIEEMIAAGAAPVVRQRASKEKDVLEQEPWFSSRDRRDLERYAQAIAADRAARAKQRSLDLELTRQRSAA